MTDAYHMILVQERHSNMAPRFDCAPFCPGPWPHVHEHRAPDIRPSTATTKAFKALDARGPDAEEGATD